MKSSIIKVTSQVNDVPGVFKGSTLSTTIWFTGCSIGCEGCHNKVLKNSQEGMDLEDVKVKILERSKLADWVVFMGGEPLNDYNNAFALESLLVYAKDLGLKTFVYTGYNRRQASKRVYNLLSDHKIYMFIDYIKYGKYDTNYIKEDYIKDFFFATVNQEVRTGKGKLVYGYDLDSRSIINNL